MKDPWWNPAVEEQAIMRIHRIGQTKAVSIKRFIVKVRTLVGERVLDLSCMALFKYVWLLFLFVTCFFFLQVYLSQPCGFFFYDLSWCSY